MEGGLSSLIWMGALAALGGAALVCPRVFVVLYLLLLVFESAVLAAIDVVHEGARLYPQDVMTVILLVLWPVLGGRSRWSFRGPRAAIWTTIAVLIIPALTGVVSGAQVRDVIRDLRPAMQLLIVFPLYHIVVEERTWTLVPLWLSRFAIIAAACILLGAATGWRILGVADSWTSSTTASASVSRGYGFISSYTFLPLLAYLKVLKCSCEQRWSTADVVTTVLLVVATCATFVRADVLMLASMLAVHLALSPLASLGSFRTCAKLCGGLVVAGLCFWSAAQVHDYSRAMFERAASIVVPEAAGEEGIGTYKYRLRSFDIAMADVASAGRTTFGFGYGNNEGMNQEKIGYYNHNSFAWMLHRGGWAGLGLALSALVWLAASYVSGSQYAPATAVGVISILTGIMVVSGSSGFLFNGYQPTGMIVLAIVLAWAEAASATPKLAGPAGLPEHRQWQEASAVA